MPNPTNLLSMPLVVMNVFTGTNEDWVDSIKWLVDTGGGDAENMPQLDIRGIKFEMEVRRSTIDHEVIISASTETGGLAIGEPPDYGFLLINIDERKMYNQQPGEYVADIVGTDAETIRRVADIRLTLIQGVTR
jgi:hypothetical protein